MDPHAWTDPEVASVWLGHIADTLASADPANADTYRANAGAAQERLATLSAEIEATLAPVRGRAFVVPHDALQYFEIAFDMPAAGAIALSDASAPGPARIRAVQDQIVEQGITCVLTDPLVSSDWVTLVTEGTEARSAVADPIGQPVTPVSGQYEAMMRALATGLADCLSAG